MTGLSEWLEDFYEAIGAHPDIGASHISLYLALVHRRQTDGGNNPVIIYRKNIAAMARISRRTFNRCMIDLQRSGFLQYEPSTNSFKGSKVYINRL